MQPEATDRVHCPQCQTTKLKVLDRLDRIEKLYGNPLMNRMRARRGDTIYHCVYCRLQFYDPRKPSANARERGTKRQPEPSPSQDGGPGGSDRQPSRGNL